MTKQKKAAALKYGEGNFAPIITASAKGFMAQRMLELAKEKKIPIVQDQGLSEVLSVQEVGAEVPQETWEALAKIFAFVIKLEKKHDIATQN